jgi:hypothetical protein
MRLGQRIGKLEAIARARRGRDEPVALIIMPDRWPAAERVRYDAATDAGDVATCWEVIARQEGVRPGPATRLIVLRLHRDEPQ